MSARSTLRRIVASTLVVLVTFGVLAETVAADTFDPAGPSPAEITTLFGPGGELDFIGATNAIGLIESGIDLSGVDPASGAIVGEDANGFLTDQLSLLTDLAMADQLNAEALRAAERARLEAQRRQRGRRLPDSIPFAGLFEEAGERHGVDPALLAAVAQAESGFAPDVINCSRRSSAGALGIMQFMPGTAAGFGIDPCDPAQAIDAGARYLKGLYDQFGDWDIALAGYNWGPNRAQIRNRNAWPAETRAYVAKVNASWAAYSAASTDGGGGQGEVGPEGCPTYAAPNTLRRGAEAVGVYELCRRSVAGAPTPMAARAIAMSLTPEFLGKPYSQPRRNEPGWYDCSSFITRAYTRSGTPVVGSWPPTTHSMVAGVSWARRIAVHEGRPGDLAFSSAPGHVGMLLSDGFWVHTNRTGDIAHVTKAPGSQLTLRVTGPA